MTLPERESLAHELQQILDDYRDATTPTETEQGRLWQRIDVAIATPATAASLGLRVIVGVALIAGIATVANAIDRADATASAHPGAPAIAEPSARTSMPGPALPPPQIAAAAVPSTPQPSAPARRDDRRRTATPAIDDGLARELALLQRARVALGRGDPEAALGVLAEHERSFPDGELVEERRAVRIIALCDAGKAPQGRAEARAFLAGHPSSTLAGRIRSACAIE
ncbi:MAG TPA: hypothetical protein VG755_38635 [Nannocystaceae bacterium]|nr:hypothetical protein [Nannocystaceae bacterium]